MPRSASQSAPKLLLTDRNGIRHHTSLPIGGASPAITRELVDRAWREVHPRLADLVAATPDPFLQTIVDVIVARMVFDRVCLLGDAAFIVRPHTAGAVATAARAMVLAAALKRARQNVDAGLKGVVTLLKKNTRICTPQTFSYPTETASRHTFIAGARKIRCVLAEIRWRWTLKILWGAARTKILVAWQQTTERSMSQANNLRRCHTTFDQDTSLIAVVEMSHRAGLSLASYPEYRANQQTR